MPIQSYCDELQSTQNNSILSSHIKNWRGKVRLIQSNFHRNSIAGCLDGAIYWPNCYPLQLTAYCGAINRMYGTRINGGVVVVALPNSEAQVFLFALGGYWLHWLARLVRYWEQQSTPLAARALGLIHGEYRL